MALEHGYVHFVQRLRRSMVIEHVVCRFLAGDERGHLLQKEIEIIGVDVGVECELYHPKRLNRLEASRTAGRISLRLSEKPVTAPIPESKTIAAIMRSSSARCAL